MEVKASLKQLRIAPRKVRVVADQIRGASVPVAIKRLEGLVKRGAMPVLKLLQSAVANAEHNNNLVAEQLVVKAITVDEGVMLKRFMPRAFGRAAMIRKRASHIEITLDVDPRVKVASKPKAKAEKKSEEKVEEVVAEEVVEAPVEVKEEATNEPSKDEVKN